jgi:hypothetical protein
MYPCAEEERLADDEGEREQHSDNTDNCRRYE